MNCIRLCLQQEGGSRSDYTVDGHREPAVDFTEFGVWSRHCVAGGASAAITKTLSAPLDRVKIHMQITNHDGFWTTAKHVYGRQGVRGFWRGNVLNVLKSSPEFAIRFGVYDLTKRQLMTAASDDRGGHLNSYERFAAGALAGVCGQTPVYPFETIKTRLTVGNYKSVTEVVTTTYKSGGLLAFFKGFWLSTMSVFLFTGIDLMIYENTKLWLTKRSDHAPDDHAPDTNWSVNLVSATCSTILGVSICYPISTLITRVQVDGGHPGLPTVKKLKHNFRGLYRGFLGSFVKMLPSTCASYVIYEELCKCLGVRMS